MLADWRIISSDLHETVCYLRSGSLSAHNTFSKDDGTLIWSTFVTYERPAARIIWPPVSLPHRLLVRISLQLAASP